MPQKPYILGSQSAGRLQLLSALVGEDAIDVRPPLDPDEAGFSGLNDWASIREQLHQIAAAKFDDVAGQVKQSGETSPVIVCADTVIVANEPDASCVVLGKPPIVNWQAEVKRWFRQYYIDTVHYAATVVYVGRADQGPTHGFVKTDIRFRPNVEHLIDWYVETGEPVGKAGGYAIQGAGSMFVGQIDGSFSNIVGLPLELVQELIATSKSH